MNRENPMGLNGFEFVEFTGPDPEALAGLFVAMGFAHIGNHRSKDVRHYRQGDINFILNMEPTGQVAGFRDAHGPSANAMAFRVADAAKALKLATERGAKRVNPAVRVENAVLVTLLPAAPLQTPATAAPQPPGNPIRKSLKVWNVMVPLVCPRLVWFQ